jgi:hypothetical protein
MLLEVDGGQRVVEGGLREAGHVDAGVALAEQVPAVGRELREHVGEEGAVRRVVRLEEHSIA